jgi:glycosyltransferase involved in cell wall biosynthesis
VFNKSLTVVLPVYNGETRLRKSVHEILELASELTSKFGVLIIDDGSNDATYEVAEELAAHYPQVSVRRQRHRSGLGSAIDYAQRSVRSDAIIMHDGVTPIDAGEIRSFWRRWIAQTPASNNEAGKPATLKDEMCDLANLPAIHAALERAHGRLIGFQMVTPAQTDEAFDKAFAEYDMPTASSTLRSDSPRNTRAVGVGQIPSLPRPKFLTALANFALGE